VVETAIVEGDSMLPTLSSGDRVLVFQRRAPKRFSIVVFSDPLDGSISIKRVIGLPGEVIEIRSLPRANQQQAPVQGHAVLVNREPLSEPYAVTDVPVSAEPFKVPAGELYLLGDNRGNSLDSRDYGPVKRSAVRGTAVAVYYPLSHFKWLRPPKG
jgi:signal peptidase I